MESLTDYAARIQTVTEISRSLRGLIETQFRFVTVLGEISNLRSPQSGHLYFVLKDAEAQLRGVLFKTQRRYLPFSPADGQQVICRGRLSVYEARGEYQLIADFMEPRGAGALQLAFEELKKKLATEGLFEEQRKRPLPFLPSRVAVITSPTGAAVIDFLKVAAARFPGVPIDIFPVRVQGEGAAQEIVSALQAVNGLGAADVIVLCRGGGSLEDLWSFNEERVARAIFASAIPVVSAIGHEIDFTISDFVADYRAPTPSAAAVAVIPERDGLQRRVAGSCQRLLAAVTRRIERDRGRLAGLRRVLRDPTTLLEHYLLRTDYQAAAMIRVMTHRISQTEERLARLAESIRRFAPQQRVEEQQRRLLDLDRRLQRKAWLLVRSKRELLARKIELMEAVSPLRVLARGYSIVRSCPGKHVIRAASEVEQGQPIEILLHEGRILSRVTDVMK